MNAPFLREFRLSAREGTGVRCDPNGAFVGAVPLLEHRCNEWVARNPDSLSGALSRIYGLPVDVGSKCKGLAAVARALNKGDVALAQTTTLFLEFPDPLSLTKRAPSRDEAVRLVHALHLSGLLKIDDLHYPAKTPDDMTL